MTVRRTVFALLFVSYAYFYQAGGWNQNSRFALVRAITNDGTLRIDPYQGNTGDKAFFEGHYYSDKAPGQALLAVAAVAPVRKAYLMAGGDAETFAGLALLSWVATIFTVGLFTAWAGVVIFDIAAEWGGGDDAGLFAALTFGLATPMWCLATVFIGHALAASCLVFAFAAAYRVSTERERVETRVLAPPPSPASRDRRNGWIIGLGAGWATVSEFPAAIPAVILAGWTAVAVRSLGRQRAMRILSSLAAGALLSVAVLMSYQWACFGSPFHLAYSSESGDFGGMQQGLFGITRPTAHALYQILVSEYRGLLPLSPIIAAAPIGLALVARQGGATRPAAAVAALIALFYVLLNASYHYWEGGWSLGPRHLAPALPFLCLGLAPLWRAGGRILRWTLLGLATLSFAITAIAVSTMVQPPANIARPFRELIWPAFRDGDLALNTQSFAHHTVDAALWRTHEEPKAAFNLGMRLGLDGHASLAPLAAIWVAGGVWLIAGRRSERRPR